MDAKDVFTQYRTTLGKKIPELREAKKWSETEFATLAQLEATDRHIKVLVDDICKVEKGELSPNHKLRTMLGDALDFDLNTYATGLADDLARKQFSELLFR